MIFEPYEQPVSISSTNRITVLHYSYGCATLSATYVRYPLVQNHCVTLVLGVRHLICSPRWLRLPTESLCYTTHMAVQR